MEKNVIYTLQLVLTKKCNLHCRYCYVIQKSEEMELDIAQAAIKKAVTKAEKMGAGLDISFMGGEPLLAFDRMREICEWTWRAYGEDKIVFRAPTNGTLLTAEMCGWFRENKNRISLALSYDGALYQNNNRSNSKELINTVFFTELWPDQPWKMTISEGNVPGLAQNIISLQESGILLGVNCACGEPPWKEESFHEFGRQMFLLADYYLAHPDIQTCELLDLELENVFLAGKPMARRCGIGQNYCNVDCDGKEYPCHMFSPLALQEDQIEPGLLYKFEDRSDFTVAGCETCILNQICPKCYGMAYKCTGNPFTKDINMCKAFKYQVKAACVYQIKKQFLKKERTSGDNIQIAAIKKIIREMNWKM